MQGNRSGNVGARRDSQRGETMSATGSEGEAFRVGRVIGRSFSVLARNIAPVGLLALAMLSVPYVLGHLLGIRHFGGPFVDPGTFAWSWREALALTLEYFLATCLGAVLAVAVYETLQGRRPGAWASIRHGLVRLPGPLSVEAVLAMASYGAVAPVRRAVQGMFVENADGVWRTDCRLAAALDAARRDAGVEFHRAARESLGRLADERARRWFVDDVANRLSPPTMFLAREWGPLPVPTPRVSRTTRPVVVRRDREPGRFPSFSSHRRLTMPEDA